MRRSDDVAYRPVESGKTHRYTCSTCARRGKTAFPGQSVPMDKFDSQVTEDKTDQLLDGERLWALLSTHRVEHAAALYSRLTSLEREAETVAEKLKGLYKLIEEGVANMDDMLNERIATLKADHVRANDAWERARGNIRSKAEVSPESVEMFGRLMRKRITEGEAPGRKARIDATIDRIEVDGDHLRIVS